MHVGMLFEDNDMTGKIDHAKNAKWLYQKRVGSFEEMINISKKSRDLYAKNYSLQKLTTLYHLESKHKDAVKLGFETSTGRGVIESVLLYDQDRRMPVFHRNSVAP